MVFVVIIKGVVWGVYAKQSDADEAATDLGGEVQMVPYVGGGK
jgi:hypothetical protein